MVVAVEIEGDLALEVFFEADVGPFREFFGALGVHHMSAARHGFNKERLGLRRFRGSSCARSAIDYMCIKSQSQTWLES